MWTTSTVDLRNLLSDGATDKYAYRKKVFGDLDGTNTIFKTFEWRRTTDFATTVSGSPVGVYVNNTFAPVIGDDLNIGEFTISGAPANGAVMQATYYYQWFLDTELDVFLKNAVQWMGLGSDVTQIPDGLQPAALHYAAQEAYQKLALRWSYRISEIYLLEDAPADTKAPVQQYLELAKMMREKAVELLENFYTRQKMPMAPNSVSLYGRVDAVTPRR